MKSLMKREISRRSDKVDLGYSSGLGRKLHEMVWLPEFRPLAMQALSDWICKSCTHDSAVLGSSFHVL